MIYFTSDTHYGHAGILEKPGLRPASYANVTEMDEAILDACNRTVGRNDTLYHLGDFAWTNAAHYRQRIRCRDIRLIFGNHDKRSIANLFRAAWDVHQVKITDGKEKKLVWLSHYAHAVWPASHYGSLHLYGHNHGQREQTFDSLWPERRSMDVGVDYIHAMLGQPRPVSEMEVTERLLARTGHDRLEFYDQKDAQ